MVFEWPCSSSLESFDDVAKRYSNPTVGDTFSVRPCASHLPTVSASTANLISSTLDFLVRFSLGLHMCKVWCANASRCRCTNARRVFFGPV
jgi:hypothetical protein